MRETIENLLVEQKWGRFDFPTCDYLTRHIDTHQLASNVFFCHQEYKCVCLRVASV